MGILEISIIIFNILSVYYAAKNNIWTWWYGIGAGLLLGWTLYTDKLYMSFIFNLYSVIMCCIGLYRWDKKNNKDIEITNDFNDKTSFMNSLIICMGLFFVIYFLNVYSDYPVIDSLCTAESFIALYLLVRRRMSSWFFWITSDVLYICGIGPYDHKYIFIYGTMFALALYGFVNWLKEYDKIQR